MTTETYTQEIWCKHQQFIATLGYTWCDIGHAPCNNTCGYLEPDSYEVTVTSTSTKEKDNE